MCVFWGVNQIQMWRHVCNTFNKASPPPLSPSLPPSLSLSLQRTPVWGRESRAGVPTWPGTGGRSWTWPAPPESGGALECTGGSVSGGAAGDVGPHSLLPGGREGEGSQGEQARDWLLQCVSTLAVEETMCCGFHRHALVYGSEGACFLNMWVAYAAYSRVPIFLASE